MKRTRGSERCGRRCIAYVQLKISANGWAPCTHRAMAASRFCRLHEGAVNGVILGLWVNGFPERSGINANPVRGEKAELKSNK